MLAVLAGLVVLTLLAARMPDGSTRWLVAPDTASRDDWRSGGAVAEVEVDASGLHLDGTGGDGWLKRELSLEPGGSRGVIRVEATVETLREPTSRWDSTQAAIMLWFSDADGRDFGGTTLVHLDRPTHARRIQREVAVPERASGATLAVLARQSDGAFDVTAISAAQVLPSPRKRIARTVVLVAWAAVAAVLAVWLVRTAGWTVGLPVAGLAALVLVGVVLPESLGARVWDHARAAVAGATGGNLALTPVMLFKGGHFLMFAATSFVAFANASRLRTSVPVMLVGMILLAAGSEAVQMHLSDRTAGTFDLGIDVAGILTALVLVLLWQSLAARRERRQRCLRSTVRAASRSSVSH